MAGKVLQKRVLFWNSTMALGLPHKRSSCSKMLGMLIDKLHPVILAKFDTLNWLPMLLRVWKHAL